MYIEELKKLYFEQRSKLESSRIYGQESRMRIIQKRKDLIKRVESRLETREIEGRQDIAEEIKDEILRESQAEEKFTRQIEANVSSAYEELEKQGQEQLSAAKYSPQEFADYLFQLELVSSLEDLLSEERLFPEEVYWQQKDLRKGG